MGYTAASDPIVRERARAPRGGAHAGRSNHCAGMGRARFAATSRTATAS